MMLRLLKTICLNYSVINKVIINWMVCRTMPNIYVITNEFEASMTQPTDCLLVCFSVRQIHITQVSLRFLRVEFCCMLFFSYSSSSFSSSLKDNIYIEYCAIATRNHAIFTHNSDRFIAQSHHVVSSLLSVWPNCFSIYWNGNLWLCWSLWIDGFASCGWHYFFGIFTVQQPIDGTRANARVGDVVYNVI